MSYMVLFSLMSCNWFVLQSNQYSMQYIDYTVSGTTKCTMNNDYYWFGSFFWRKMLYYLSMARPNIWASSQPPLDHYLLIIEVPQSHSGTLTLGRTKSDQPYPETSALQHTTLTRDMKREDQQDATIRCLLLTSVSTCFGHHYAHLQEKNALLLHLVCCSVSAGCDW